MTDVDNCARAFFFTPKLYKPFRDLADCKEVSGQGDKDALRTTYEPKCAVPLPQAAPSPVAPARGRFSPRGSDWSARLRCRFVDPNFLTIRNHARYKYLLALDGAKAPRPPEAPAQHPRRFTLKYTLIACETAQGSLCRTASRSCCTLTAWC